MSYYIFSSFLPTRRHSAGFPRYYGGKIAGLHPRDGPETTSGSASRRKISVERNAGFLAAEKRDGGAQSRQGIHRGHSEWTARAPRNVRRQHERVSETAYESEQNTCDKG